MLYYDRISVSEGIYVNKTSVSKECDACHYWYFLNYNFKFQPNVCNRCHDLLLMSVDFSDITIFNIKGSDYRCIISLISKNEGTNYYKMLIWLKKVEHYKFKNKKNNKKIKILESYMKMEKNNHKIRWYRNPKAIQL